MKKILFFLMALLITVPVCAQDDGEELQIGKPQKNALFIGPKVGLGLTSMSQPDEGKLADGSGLGFAGGLSAKLRFGRATENSAGGTGYWGFGLDLRYKKNSAKTIATSYDDNLNIIEDNAKINTSYLDIPVYFTVYPFAKSSALNSLYIEAGVSFGILLSRSPNYLEVYNPSELYSYALYTLDNGNGNRLKGGDIHPIIGVGYTIPKTGLEFNVRYNIGTTKLANNFPCKMSTLEISLAWMFSAAKF